MSNEKRRSGDGPQDHRTRVSMLVINFTAKEVATRRVQNVFRAGAFTNLTLFSLLDCIDLCQSRFANNSVALNDGIVGIVVAASPVIMAVI